MIEQGLLKLKGNSLLQRWRENYPFNFLLEIFNYYHYNGQTVALNCLMRLWFYLNLYPHEKNGRLQSCETLLFPPVKEKEERASEEDRVTGKWGCIHSPSEEEYLLKHGKPEVFWQLSTPLFLIKVGAASLHHKSNTLVSSVPSGIQSTLPVI